MERNIKVARAHRALSWLYLVIIASIVVLMFLRSGGIDLGGVVPLVIMSAIFLAHHVTAKGARQSKPWARTSSIVISVLLLIGFPIGTLIGIYLLSNTWRPWEASDASEAAA
jgi:hypothetical protein